MADHLVPTIDISAPTDSMLSELDQACIDYGFFLLSGHGLDELIERTWAVTEQFFAGHRASKLAVIRDADTFHDTLGEFYDSCSDLAVRANELVHRALGFATASEIDSTASLDRQPRQSLVEFCTAEPLSGR